MAKIEAKHVRPTQRLQFEVPGEGTVQATVVGSQRSIRLPKCQSILVVRNGQEFQMHVTRWHKVEVVLGGISGLN